MIISNKKNKFWKFDEVKILLEIWKERKDNLKKTKRDTIIYLDILNNLKEYNIDVTLEQLKSKIHNLRTKYKREQKAEASGESPSDWPFFNDMKEIGSNIILDFCDYMEKSCDPLSPIASRPLTSRFGGPSTSAFTGQSISVISESSSSASESSKLTPPKRKKLRKCVKAEILEKIELNTFKLNDFIKNSEEVDKQMLENESKIIEIERKKADIMEQMLEETKRFNEFLLKKM